MTSIISSRTAKISVPLFAFSRRNRAKFLDISKKQLVLDSGAFRDFPGLLNYTVIILSEYHKCQGNVSECKHQLVGVILNWFGILN